MVTKNKTNVAAGPKSSAWNFFSNHFHVLICLALEPATTLRDVATRVGITERAVQRLVTELEDEGYVTRQKVGRQNHYQLDLEKSLRHPLEKHCTVSDLVEVIFKDSPLA